MDCWLGTTVRGATLRRLVSATCTGTSQMDLPWPAFLRALGHKRLHHVE